MIIEGEIIDITNDGRGVVKKDGKVTFVENALPGDIVKIEITKEKKNFNLGRVKQFLTYSQNRRFKNGENPLGEAYPLFALDYDFGFNLKQNIVKNNFKKFLNLEINIVPHKNEDYRVNKLRLHKAGKKVGLFENKTNKIYVPDMETLLGEGASELYKDITENISGGKFVTIRRADNGDFLSTDGTYTGKLFTDYKDRNRSSKIHPVMEIAGKKYEMEIDGFFQNNRYGAEKALEIIGNKRTGKILDLYSGVGLISLFVADKASEVLGVELWEPSVINARENAKLNNITNAKFIAMDTGDLAKEKLPLADTVIVDPPRSGLVPELIERIKEMAPKEIVYMSCDHTTQIRDIKMLLPEYEIKDSAVHVIDMFPGTMHCETIVLLSKPDSK
ncbi:MAG: methyltransferase [Ezakiella sp.]|uniref:class I SAM-dependent RNA methyltransferase n=1 Tax=Ezakiella sp. TaxID=1935205 RepID=UPI0029745A59|nr:methyltransferase [Ezakiella sp.]MDD7731940.1 methyltransferase [Eubacteriales bacterium]MDY6080169.1 methyltransferase [Ezakiella sp.]